MHSIAYCSEIISLVYTYCAYNYMIVYNVRFNNEKLVIRISITVLMPFLVSIAHFYPILGCFCNAQSLVSYMRILRNHQPRTAHAQLPYYTRVLYVCTYYPRLVEIKVVMVSIFFFLLIPRPVRPFTRYQNGNYFVDRTTVSHRHAV